MKKIVLELNDTIDVDEFRKTVSFVSNHIVDTEVINNQLVIQIDDDSVEEVIKSDLQKIMSKYKKNDSISEVYFQQKKQNRSFYELYENNNLIYFSNCQIGFGEKGMFLYDYFDGMFKKMALKRNAIQKRYPVLLNVNSYLQTGYVKKSPQYAMFCSSVNDDLADVESLSDRIKEGSGKNNLKEPDYALSPSACFHTYIEYQDCTLDENTLVTFNQNVFRNEGRLNYKEKGRLMDYNVREIVMIGSNEYVIKIRDEILADSKEFMISLGIDGNIALATDSFILPKMQIYKKMQKIDKSKYEMHLSVSEDKEISTASYNYHGHAFTDPFNINVANLEDTVTGCIGFGIQRWIVAFISQFGWDESNWPQIVRDEYMRVKNEITK